MKTQPDESQVDKKHDLKTQATIGKDCTLDSYDKVGLEDFGKSVLKRFGWKEPSKPDSRFATNPIPRHLRLGLGATPANQPARIDGQ